MDKVEEAYKELNFEEKRQNYDIFINVDIQGLELTKQSQITKLTEKEIQQVNAWISQLDSHFNTKTVPSTKKTAVQLEFKKFFLGDEIERQQNDGVTEENEKKGGLSNYVIPLLFILYQVFVKESK